MVILITKKPWEKLVYCDLSLLHHLILGIGLLFNTKTLRLSENHLSGTLPSELGQLTALTMLGQQN